MARRRVTEAARAAGAGSDLVDDVALVVSELVTNAVRHARPLPDGTIEVAWSASTGSGPLTVAVKDGGGLTRPVASAPPNLREPSDSSALVALSGGRGLGIVSTVVEDWGVEVDASGATVVWAALDPNRGAFLHTR